MLLVSAAFADTFWECDTVATPEDAWQYHEADPSDPYAEAEAEVYAWYDATCAVATCTFTDSTSISCEEIDCVTSSGATWYSNEEQFGSGYLIDTVRVVEVTPPVSAGLGWTYARLDYTYDVDTDDWDGTWAAEWTGTLLPDWPSDASFSAYMWAYSGSKVSRDVQEWTGPSCAWREEIEAIYPESDEYTVQVNADPEINVFSESWDCTFDLRVTARVDGVAYGAVEVDGWADDADDVDRDGYLGSVSDCVDTDPLIHPCATDTDGDGIDSDCSGVDLDGDGALAPADGGDDCDDSSATVYVGAVEVPYDGIDQDCDGVDLTDVDGDGGDAAAAGGTDCDDTDATIYRGAAEVPYDTIDQDCDGADLIDQDGDGGDALVTGGTDCDDLDATRYAGAPEVECDAIDQDCDGADDCTDVDDTGPTPDPDDTGPTPDPEDTGTAETEPDCGGGSGGGCAGGAGLLALIPLALRRRRPEPG